MTPPSRQPSGSRNVVVAADINVGEIVVLGKVRGKLVAGDRVDIRSEGSLTGDVVARHISIIANIGGRTVN